MESTFEAYRGKPPAFVPVYITNKTVDLFARRLSWAERPGVTDLVSLEHWLLCFGEASSGLRKIVGEFRYWMANGRPPWAAYRELMLGHLIGLNKFPGVRPVGVVETW